MKIPIRIFFCFFFLVLCLNFSYSQIAKFKATTKNGTVLLNNGSYVCNIDSIQLVDLSTGSPTAWEWTINGALMTNFNGQNPPVVKYPTTSANGTLGFQSKIILKITKGAIISKDSILLIILYSPRSAFYISSLTQIAPATISFNNDSKSFNVLNKWDFGDGFTGILDSVSHIFNDVGVYNVCLIVSNLNQCFDTACKKIIIENQAVLTLPNAFSPNDDGENINELFRPDTLIGIKTINCRMFDRWGNLIYSWEGVNGYWDGYTTGGQPCSEGVYFYSLDAITEDNKKLQRKGYVQLVR